MLPLHDTIPSRTTPLVTRGLILINALVFFFELALPERALEAFIHLFGIVPARYTHPQWAAWVGFPVDDYWPLLTHQFLHGGWTHFLGNMWTLWIFGDNVEDRMGHARFLIFYLLCGVAAGLVQMASAPDSTVPMIGASGAISGLLGAYLLWYPHSRLIMFFPIFFLPYFFEVPALLYLGWWFFIQLFSGTLSLVAPQPGGGIAWWAHIGGFIAGAVFCWLFRRPRRQRWRRIQPDEYDGIEWAWGRYRD
jgi:membrane associated rhomboid family serine protease